MNNMKRKNFFHTDTKRRNWDVRTDKELQQQKTTKKKKKQESVRK